MLQTESVSSQPLLCGMLQGQSDGLGMIERICRRYDMMSLFPIKHP
jgi:hypothetical protein